MTVTDGTNTTQYDPKGTTINPGAKWNISTDKGLNNGGKVISNVASGGDVDTNAANIGDVKKATAASKRQYLLIRKIQKPEFGTRSNRRSYWWSYELRYQVGK